jgi:hypothetical protein
MAWPSSVHFHILVMMRTENEALEIRKNTLSEWGAVYDVLDSERNTERFRPLFLREMMKRRKCDERTVYKDIAGEVPNGRKQQRHTGGRKHGEFHLNRRRLLRTELLFYAGQDIRCEYARLGPLGELFGELRKCDFGREIFGTKKNIQQFLEILPVVEAVGI